MPMAGMMKRISVTAVLVWLSSWIKSPKPKTCAESALLRFQRRTMRTQAPMIISL